MAPFHSNGPPHTRSAASCAFAAYDRRWGVTRGAAVIRARDGAHPSGARTWRLVPTADCWLLSTTGLLSCRRVLWKRWSFVTASGLGRASRPASLFAAWRAARLHTSRRALQQHRTWIVLGRMA
jgi:hypothetical protein